MIAAWLTIARAAAGPGCDVNSLERAIGRAETAFTAMDAAGFDAAMADGWQSLACQIEPLTPTTCADWHRTVALDAFTHKDMEDTVLAFRAALDTTPGFDLPLTIAPEGTPLRVQFEQARAVVPSGTITLATPSDGWVAVDGQRSLVAPAGWPFVFQRFDAEGGVAQTAYVEVGASLPTYAIPAIEDATAEHSTSGKKKHSGVLIGVGVGAGLVSAGLFAGALASKHEYTESVSACEDNPGSCADNSELHSLKTRTNALGVASLASAGLGVTLVVVGW